MRVNVPQRAVCRMLAPLHDVDIRHIHAVQVGAAEMPKIVKTEMLDAVVLQKCAERI